MSPHNVALMSRAHDEAAESPGMNWTHEPEAEAAVVAACLLNADRNAAFATVSAILCDRDFYVPPYRVMFQAIAALHGRREPVDIITVKAELAAMDCLNTAGGVQALGAVTDQLVTEVGTVWNVDHHARIVADRAVRRKVELFGRGLSVRAKSLGAPIAATLAGSIAALGAIPLPVTPPRTMSHDLDQLVDTLEGKRPAPKAPVATGIADFDTALMGGLRPGAYYLIGLSGSGKTTLTTQMAVHVARTRGPVLFVEKEEPRAAMRNKFLATLARLPLWKVVRAEERPFDHGLSDAEVDTLFAAINTLNGLPLYLYGLDDPDSPETINDAFAVARSMAMRPVAIFLDNLGQMKTRINHGAMRDMATKERTEDLRAGAEALQIPVWTLVHPKAGVAKSKERMGLGDIEGGEKVGQICHGCFFLHDETRHPTRGKNDPPATPGVLELYSDKLRGPVSAVFCELQKVAHEHRFASTRRTDANGQRIDDDGPDAEPASDDRIDPRASMVRARSPGPVPAGDDVLDRYGAGDGLPDTGGAPVYRGESGSLDLGPQYEEGAA